MRQLFLTETANACDWLQATDYGPLRKKNRPAHHAVGRPFSSEFRPEEIKNYFLVFLAAFFFGEGLAAFFAAFFAMSVAPTSELGAMFAFTRPTPSGTLQGKSLHGKNVTHSATRSRQIFGGQTFHQPPSATLAARDAARIETELSAIRQDEFARDGKNSGEERVE